MPIDIVQAQKKESGLSKALGTIGTVLGGGLAGVLTGGAALPAIAAGASLGGSAGNLARAATAPKGQRPDVGSALFNGIQSVASLNAQQPDMSADVLKEKPGDAMTAAFERRQAEINGQPENALRASWHALEDPTSGIDRQTRDALRPVIGQAYFNMVRGR